MMLSELIAKLSEIKDRVGDRIVLVGNEEGVMDIVNVHIDNEDKPGEEEIFIHVS